MHRLLSLLTVAGLLWPSALALAAPPSPRSFLVEVTGSGPPVLLIPGLACPGDVWSTTVARYRSGHQLHVLTIAGFGGTKPPVPPPLLKTVRDELAAYVREHKLQRPIVVGHSLGGFVALWLAASEPDLVGGVVVVDALPFLPVAFNPAATVETVKPQAQMMREMLAHATPEQYAAQNRAAVATMVTDPKNVELVAGWGKKADPSTVAAAMYEMMITDLRPQLDRIKARTLVLAAGEGDPTAAQKIYAAQYARLAGHRLVVAAKSRHFIMLDDPDFFFRELDGVLGGAPASPAGNR